MPFGLPVAFLFLAQAAATNYGPAADAPKAAPVKTAECAPQAPSPNPNEIVVCAVKPNGYRLDPDVVAARKAKKQGSVGRPHDPHETYADHSCANTGPMGCRGAPAVNLLAAAMTAAQIAERLSKGQEVGSIFKTEPTPSEYQLYQEAKKAREDKEAQAKADKVKAAAETAAPKPQPTK
jgi:hypothetical protein